MGGPSGGCATRRFCAAQIRDGHFAAGATPFGVAVAGVRCRNGTIRCMDSGSALHPSGLPAKTRRMRAGTRRILAISGLVVVAVALALMESVQDHLASAGFR